jgi:hypothetical protein
MRGRNALNLEGVRFGRLVPMCRVQSLYKDRSLAWKCRCDCGQIVVVSTNWLRTGHSKSCGCFKRDVTKTRMSTHGMSSEPIYKTWAHMVARCKPTASAKDRATYYAMGIRVCEEWVGKGGFENFLSHIGLKPSPKHSLDRIDSKGNYEPGNVRWATSQEQYKNRCIRKIEDFSDVDIINEAKKRGLL